MNADTAMAQALEGLAHSAPVQTRNGIRHYLGPKLLTLDPTRARITSRPVSTKVVAAELLWMLNGLCDSVKPLQDVGVRIWDKWAAPDGHLGPIYGKQWLMSDQVDRAIAILSRNPGSTQAMVDAWNPADINNMALPPCHFAHQIISTPVFVGDNDHGREPPHHRVAMHMFQRSCDVLIGLPYNMAFYGLLLQVYVNRLNIHAQGTCTFQAGPLHMHISHAHVYAKHLEDPAVRAWTTHCTTSPGDGQTPRWVLDRYEVAWTSKLTNPDIAKLTEGATLIEPTFPDLKIEVIA